MGKARVITSRKWRNPEITAFANDEEVGSKIELSQFLDSIVEQMGNPSMLVTKAMLRDRMILAAEAVLKEMRETTRFVV